MKYLDLLFLLSHPIAQCIEGMFKFENGHEPGTQCGGAQQKTFDAVVTSAVVDTQHIYILSKTEFIC